MAYAVNREHVVAFLGGFLAGKIMGSLVSICLSGASSWRTLR